MAIVMKAAVNVDLSAAKHVTDEELLQQLMEEGQDSSGRVSSALDPRPFTTSMSVSASIEYVAAELMDHPTGVLLRLHGPPSNQRAGASRTGNEQVGPSGLAEFDEVEAAARSSLAGPPDSGAHHEPLDLQGMADKARGFCAIDSSSEGSLVVVPERAPQPFFSPTPPAPVEKLVRLRSFVTPEDGLCEVEPEHEDENFVVDRQRVLATRLKTRTAPYAHPDEFVADVELLLDWHARRLKSRPTSDEVAGVGSLGSDEMPQSHQLGELGEGTNLEDTKAANGVKPTDQDPARVITLEALDSLRQKLAVLRKEHLEQWDQGGPTKQRVLYDAICRQWIWVALGAQQCTEGDLAPYFNGTMTAAICAAGILVGVGTYFTKSLVLDVFDLVILVLFTIECVVKIAAEGLAPLEYFVGPDRAWNLFDFSIVVLSMPVFPFEGDSIKVLRLFRLARLIKLFKRVPQLYVIVQGLLGGLSSIGYIFVLLFLVFYLYACAGVTLFRQNDPWHWDSLGRSFITLIRAATLEDWTDIMYIGIFGCDRYYNHFGIYGEPDGSLSSSCSDPEANPIVSPLFWVTFIVIVSLVMLSLFIGTVTMSMAETMEKMKQELEIAERKAALLKSMKSMQKMQNSVLSSSSGDAGEDGEDSIGGSSSSASVSTSSRLVEYAAKKKQRALRELAVILHQAWEGPIEFDLQEDEDDAYLPGALGQYQKLSEIYIRPIARSPYFEALIVFMIFVASILVGLQTDEGLMCESRGKEKPGPCSSRDVLVALDWVTQAVFTLEVVLKLVAEELTPWVYFEDRWNVFDFVIVLGGYVLTGGLIKVLRLLRLLRLLKMVKSIPQLFIIVSALISGLGSIFYIFIILVLVYYIFAILGILLFAENDPWHFGTLDKALLSLWRVATFEDWTDIMYTNILGCNKYGYDDDEASAKCEPTALGWFAAIYFVIFVVIGALVLLTLFIGVVTTAMDDATREHEEEMELEARIKETQEEAELTNDAVEYYRKAFHLLDLDGGGTIEEDELRTGLEAIGKEVTDEELRAMMKEVDEDESGEIDFAEFLQFMVTVKQRVDEEKAESPVKPFEHEKVEADKEPSLLLGAGTALDFDRPSFQEIRAEIEEEVGTRLLTTKRSRSAMRPGAKIHAESQAGSPEATSPSSRRELKVERHGDAGRNPARNQAARHHSRDGPYRGYSGEEKDEKDTGSDSDDDLRSVLSQSSSSASPQRL